MEWVMVETAEMGGMAETAMAMAMAMADITIAVMGTTEARAIHRI
jgi:hypothetical protein